MECIVATTLIIVTETTITKIKKHNKKLNQLCLQLSTRKNCVVVDSTIEPPALLSTLLCTPQYLTDINPLAIEYTVPL